MAYRRVAHRHISVSGLPKRACRQHTKDCPNCRHYIYVRDVGATGVCVTCSRLVETPEHSDGIIVAANSLFENAGRAKRWRVARDARHTVVEADLGWTRKVLFTLRHGDQRAEYAYVKSALGSRKLTS